MATNIISLIGLYISMIYYVATGVVDPSIFDGLIADLIRNCTIPF